MTPELESLLTDVADAFRATDTSLLAPYLASWLEPDELVASFSAFEAEVLEALAYSGSPAVQEIHVADEDLSFAEVRAESGLPREISDESFRSWGYLQYIFEEDQAGVSATIDVWVAVVEVDGELRVGYAEIGEEED